MALILVWFGIVSCGFGWIYGVSVDISPGEKKTKAFSASEVVVRRSFYRAYSVCIRTVAQ